MNITHLKSEYDPDTVNTHYFSITSDSTTYFIYVQDFFNGLAYLFEASTPTEDIAYILEKYKKNYYKYEGRKVKEGNIDIFTVIDYIPDYFLTREFYYYKVYKTSKGKYINYKGHRIYLPDG